MWWADNFIAQTFGHPSIYTFRDIKPSKKFTPPEKIIPIIYMSYVSLSRREQDKKLKRNAKLPFHKEIA